MNYLNYLLPPDCDDNLPDFRGTIAHLGGPIVALIGKREVVIPGKDAFLASGVIPLDSGGRRLLLPVGKPDGAGFDLQVVYGTDDPRIIAAAIIQSQRERTIPPEVMPPLPREKALQIVLAHRKVCASGKHDSSIP